jgi:hypothetical protein
MVRIVARRETWNENYTIPEGLTAGCTLNKSMAHCTLNRSKSQVSAAASISACQMFFPWPTIVAAINGYRYFPETKAAARIKIAARSSNGVFSHSDFAIKASSIVFLTSSGVARLYSATTCLCCAGLTCLASFVSLLWSLLVYDKILTPLPYRSPRYRTL